MSEHYDVIIIGSGAGGGTLAHTLAPSGKRILLLERGNYLPREMDNWDPEPVFIDGKYISKDTWYDADGKPFQPQVHYNVGGATKLYGAALYRLRPQDFGEIRHVDGLSPAWPLAYDDFEPWYSKAEWLYQVHGNAGEDPTEGPRSQPYPWPAVSHEPRIQQLSDEMAAGGYHPFHAPCGILLDEADRAKSTCIRCTWCDGYPCLVHAKADAETIAVRPLLDLPNVTLLVDAEVTRLETDPSGRTVTGVVVSRGGDTETYAGDIVVVSAGASNSAKLLLRSANDQPPQRPRQRLGPGRPQLHVPQLQGDRRPRQGAQRHRLPEDGRPQRLLLRRPGLRLAGRQHPDDRQVQRRGDEGRGAQAHEAGPALLARRGRPPRPRLLADHRGPAQARQPRHGRRRRQHPPRLHVDQRRGGRPPLPRAEEAAEPRRPRPAPRARQELLHAHGHLGGRRRPPGRAPAASAPIPATSVLDVDCKAHELDNLYVVDTSFFPSIGAVNPALTAMANAIRVGEHLTERLG